jgi:2-isopropylmalate synthase
MTGPWSGERRAAGQGDGPIAATFAAVSEIVELPIDVVNLSVQSVTPGKDSLGQVSLQVRVNGKSLSGHGASTDIVEACARALINALNKANYAERLEHDSLNAIYLWGV